MDYFEKVNNGECLLSPQQRVINDFSPTINDFKSCFLDPKDCVKDDDSDFKDVNITKDTFDDCYFKLKKLDQYLIPEQKNN